MPGGMELQRSQKEKGKGIRNLNRKERINMQGMRVESLPRLTILILRERAATRRFRVLPPRSGARCIDSNTYLDYRRRA